MLVRVYAKENILYGITFNTILKTINIIEEYKKTVNSVDANQTHITLNT